VYILWVRVCIVFIFIVSCLNQPSSCLADQDSYSNERKDSDDLFIYSPSYVRQSVLQTDLLNINGNEIELRNMIQMNVDSGGEYEDEAHLKGPRAGNEPVEEAEITDEIIDDIVEEIETEETQEIIENDVVPDRILDFINNRDDIVNQYEIVLSDSVYKLIWVESENVDGGRYQICLKTFSQDFNTTSDIDVLFRDTLPCAANIRVLKYANGNFACLWNWAGMHVNDLKPDRCAIQVFNSDGERIGDRHLIVKNGFRHQSYYPVLIDSGGSILLLSVYSNIQMGEDTEIDLKIINDDGRLKDGDNHEYKLNTTGLSGISKLSNDNLAIYYDAIERDVNGGYRENMIIQIIDSMSLSLSDPIYFEDPGEIYLCEDNRNWPRRIDKIGVENLPNGNVAITWVNNDQILYKLKIITNDGRALGGNHVISSHRRDYHGSLSRLIGDKMIKVLSNGNIAYFTARADSDEGFECLTMNVIDQDGRIITKKGDDFTDNYASNILIDRVYELSDGKVAVIWFKHDYEDEWNDVIYMQIFDESGEMKGGVIDLSKSSYDLRNVDAMDGMPLADGRVIVFISGYTGIRSMPYILKYFIISSEGEVVEEKIISDNPNVWSVPGYRFDGIKSIFRFSNGNFLFVWPEGVLSPNTQTYYQRSAYKIFDQYGHELTEKRVLRIYDGYDGAVVNGYKIHVLPDGNIALLWIERQDEEGMCVVGSQAGLRQDLDYYYRLFMRVIGPDGNYVTDTITLDTQKNIYGLSLDDLQIHSDEGLEVLWKERSVYEEKEVIKKATLNFSGQEVDIRPYTRRVTTTQRQVSNKNLLIKTHAIAGLRSQFQWYYWLWRARRRAAITAETPRGVFDSETGSDTRVSDVYRSQKDDSVMSADEDLSMDGVGDIGDKSNTRARIANSINNRMFIELIAGQIEGESELGSLVKILESLDKRSETEEIALKASSLVVEIEKEMDGTDLKEFETVINLILSVEAFGSIEEKQDLLFVRETLGSLIEGHKRIYREYLLETQDTYNYIAEILGINIENETLPDEYRPLASFNKHAEIKIAVDLALEDLKARDGTKLSEKEKEALGLNAAKLTPLKNKYIKGLRGVISKCLKSIKERMQHNKPVALHEDKDGINAFFLFDSSYIKEKAKL